VGGVLHSLDIVIVLVLAVGAGWFVWHHWSRGIPEPDKE
jgi:hypothetical protein